MDLLIINKIRKTDDAFNSLAIASYLFENRYISHCGNNEGESNKFLVGLRFKAIPYVTLGLRLVFTTL